MVIMARPFKDDKDLENEDQSMLAHEQEFRYVLEDSAIPQPYEEKIMISKRLLTRILEIQDTFDTLVTMLAEHKERIQFLENKLQEMQLENEVDNISRRNATKLAEIFNLEIAEQDAQKDVLKEMDGMLAEYSDDAVDSVELVRSVRDAD